MEDSGSFRNTKVAVADRVGGETELEQTPQEPTTLTTISTNKYARMADDLTQEQHDEYARKHPRRYVVHNVDSINGPPAMVQVITTQDGEKIQKKVNTNYQLPDWWEPGEWSKYLTLLAEARGRNCKVTIVAEEHSIDPGLIKKYNKLYTKQRHNIMALYPQIGMVLPDYKEKQVRQWSNRI